MKLLLCLLGKQRTCLLSQFMNDKHYVISVSGLILYTKNSCNYHFELRQWKLKKLVSKIRQLSHAVCNCIKSTHDVQTARFLFFSYQMSALSPTLSSPHWTEGGFKEQQQEQKLFVL